MAESTAKAKKVKLKLTGRYCGKLTTAEGVFYCDARLPKGQKHTQVEESKVDGLIARRVKRLGLTADQADRVDLVRA